MTAFLSHAALGHVNIKLLSFSVLASITGGLLEAWLLAFKLKGPQEKDYRNRSLLGCRQNDLEFNFRTPDLYT